MNTAVSTLIVLGGLPGVGKTTIARALLARCDAAYVRIAAIEHALDASTPLAGRAGAAGYVVAYALARSNLSMGRSVLADCVNPLPVTRDAWRAVATDAAARLLEVEVVCSDSAEHRRRVESRVADIPGHVVPTWASVRRHDYAAWTTDRLIIDTARVSPDAAAAQILQAI